MIYNDEFVWVHFPKCAGVKVEILFSTYLSAEPGLFQDKLDPETDKAFSWHDSVAEREARNPSFTLGDRIVICSIRKLPSWLESRYNYEYERDPKKQHNPELLLEGKFLEQPGYVNHADVYIRKYLPQSLLSTGKVRFLRTEYFGEDFIGLFSNYVNVEAIPRDEYARRANSSANHLPAEILSRLRSSQDVYASCPEWRAVEELAYPSS